MDPDAIEGTMRVKLENENDIITSTFCPRFAMNERREVKLGLAAPSHYHGIIGPVETRPEVGGNPEEEFPVGAQHPTMFIHF
jgi:hypothetical protein